MENNIYDERFLSNRILNAHKIEVQKMGLPLWAKNIACPWCNKTIDESGIRRISICLNSRNLGDLAVEFMCKECEKMNTFYYRQKAPDIESFITILKGYPPGTDPILEENMYKLQYNNTVEKAFKKDS